mgnify:CR=1 FL=1
MLKSKLLRIAQLLLVCAPLTFAAGEVMAKANWHTYQVLTKRSQRMRDMLQTELRFAAELPHIWWGVSVEDRDHGLPRIESIQNPDSLLNRTYEIGLSEFAHREQVGLLAYSPLMP